MSGTILAIDPGTTKSGWVLADLGDGTPVGSSTHDNQYVLAMLRCPARDIRVVVVEKFESMGMSVGKEVFETVKWCGRFIEAAQPIKVVEITRREVKLNLCGSMRAKDANIRCALLDKYGGKAAAIGSKKSPGPLYFIKGHEWSALALAVTYRETLTKGG